MKSGNSNTSFQNEEIDFFSVISFLVRIRKIVFASTIAGTLVGLVFAITTASEYLLQIHVSIDQSAQPSALRSDKLEKSYNIALSDFNLVSQAAEKTFNAQPALKQSFEERGIPLNKFLSLQNDDTVNERPLRLVSLKNESSYMIELETKNKPVELSQAPLIVQFVNSISEIYNREILTNIRASTLSENTEMVEFLNEFKTNFKNQRNNLETHVLEIQTSLAEIEYRINQKIRNTKDFDSIKDFINLQQAPKTSIFNEESKTQAIPQEFAFSQDFFHQETSRFVRMLGVLKSKNLISEKEYQDFKNEFSDLKAQYDEKILNFLPTNYMTKSAVNSILTGRSEFFQKFSLAEAMLPKFSLNQTYFNSVNQSEPLQIETTHKLRYVILGGFLGFVLSIVGGFIFTLYKNGKIYYEANKLRL